MSRPIYETDEQREQQVSISAMVSMILGVRLVPTPRMASADYIVQNLKGVATGLMEIKVRSYSPEELDALGGFFLGERKLLAIHRAVVALNMDFHLVVVANKNILHLLLKADSPWPKLDRTYGGRTDRQDMKDEETLCLFPMRMFKNVATLSAGST